MNGWYAAKIILKKTDAAKTHYPARTEFVEKIPLTAAGKADKKALREDIQNKMKFASAAK